MEDYESVQKGGLKLKKGLSGVSDHGSKKKKKKSKEKKRMEEILSTTDIEGKEEFKSSQQPYKTKAELAFERAKQKKTQEQILQRATKTHKERIMEFNQHLDNLTEHFDIPKVSWTK